MRTPVTPNIGRRMAATLMVCFVATFLVPAEAPAEVTLRLNSGYVSPSGDVGDMILDGGVDFGVAALAPLSENAMIGAAVHLSVLGGQSQRGVEVTDSGGRFGIELLGQIYLAPPGGSVRPYVSGAIGYGAIGWDYTPNAQGVFQTGDDAIGYLSLTPGAGLDFPVNEQTGIYVEGRYSFAVYADETNEGYVWDLDGGHFLELLGGVRVGF